MSLIQMAGNLTDLLARHLKSIVFQLISVVEKRSTIFKERLEIENKFD